MLSLQQPYNLTDLHEKYGQFMRYGPDKLGTTVADAIPIVFQKGERMFPKTEFYDACGDGITPKSFGMQDEAVSGQCCAVVHILLRFNIGTLYPQAALVPQLFHGSCEETWSSILTKMLEY
jgi:hypothetical protein